MFMKATRKHWQLIDIGFWNGITSTSILLPDLWQTRLLRPQLYIYSRQLRSNPTSVARVLTASTIPCKRHHSTCLSKRRSFTRHINGEHVRQFNMQSTSVSVSNCNESTQHTDKCSTTNLESSDNGASSPINPQNDTSAAAFRMRKYDESHKKLIAMRRDRLDPPGLNQVATRRLVKAFNEAILYRRITPLMDVSAQLSALHHHRLEQVNADQLAADRIWLQFQRITVIPKTLRQIPINAYVLLVKQLSMGKPTTEAARRLRTVLSDMLMARRVLRKSEWNATLHAFSVCGDLTSMERVWQMMCAQESSSMIDTTPDNNESTNSQPMHIQMVKSKQARANWLIAYNTRMQAYANEGALAAVEWIWKELTEHPGLLPDRISWNTRINAHAKLGSIDSMEKCAHEMTSIYRLPWDAYTQQALLVGYGRANRWDAVDRIRAMLEQREAVWMSTRFNNSNSSNSHSDESTCKSLTSITVNYDAFTKYAHTISELPSPTAHTYTALMSLQIEQKDYVAASHTLRRMLQAGIQPTQTTVNVILRLHAEQRDLNGALHLLNQLMDSTRSNNGFSMEWRPDAYTASILLNACAQQEAYEEMHSIRQIMITLGVRFTIATLTALALGYAKTGQSKEARHFTTRSREAILDESSSNRPLSETDLVAHDYSSTGVLNTALKARSGSRVAEAVSVCCAVIRALSDAKCPDGAQAIWQDLVASGLPLGADEHNTRLYALGERCDFTALRLCYHERIMALFPRNTNEQMETDHEELLTDIARGPPANVKTFSVIIHCLAKHGKLEWAEQIYQQLLWLAGLSPHLQYIHSEADKHELLKKPHLSLTALEHARIFSILVMTRLQRHDERGAYKRYMQLTSSLKSTLTVPIYTALMDASARRNRWSRVYKLLNDLLAANLPLDTTAYNALLRAHTASKNYDAVLACLERMKERDDDMQPDARTYATIIAAAIRHQRYDLVQQWLQELGEPNAVPVDTSTTPTPTPTPITPITTPLPESPLLRNHVLATVIIRWYTMNHNLSAALAAYRRITELATDDTEVKVNNANGTCNSIPDLTTRHALLSAYAREGDLNNAVQIYEELCKDGLTPTSETFAILLTSCRRATMLQQLKQKHNESEDNESTTKAILYWPTTTTSSSSSSSSSSSLPRLPAVIEIWRRMCELKINPDTRHARRAIFSVNSPSLLMAVIRMIRRTPIASTPALLESSNTHGETLNTITVHPLLESDPVKEAIAETARRVGWSDQVNDLTS